MNTAEKNTRESPCCRVVWRLASCGPDLHVRTETSEGGGGTTLTRALGGGSSRLPHAPQPFKSAMLSHHHRQLES